MSDRDRSIHPDSPPEGETDRRGDIEKAVDSVNGDIERGGTDLGATSPTEPTVSPCALIAISEPGGRGADPQVRTTVASAAGVPAATHALAVRSTRLSRSSMAVSFCGIHAVGVQGGIRPRAAGLRSACRA